MKRPRKRIKWRERCLDNRSWTVFAWEQNGMMGGAAGLSRELGCPAKMAWEIYTGVRYISGRLAAR